MTADNEFERNPEPASMDAHIEFEGEESLVKVGLESSKADGIRIDIETIYGKTTLTEKEFAEVAATIDRFRVALHAVRGTQP